MVTCLSMSTLANEQLNANTPMWGPCQIETFPRHPLSSEQVPLCAGVQVCPEGSGEMCPGKIRLFWARGAVWQRRLSRAVGSSSRPRLLPNKPCASTLLELALKTSPVSYILDPSPLGPGI